MRTLRLVVGREGGMDLTDGLTGSHALSLDCCVNIPLDLFAYF